VRSASNQSGAVAPKFDQAKESAKYKITDDCKLEFLKLNKILDLGDDYILVRHPFA